MSKHHRMCDVQRVLVTSILVLLIARALESGAKADEVCESKSEGGMVYILTQYDLSFTSRSDTYRRPGNSENGAYQRFLITTEVSGTHTFYTESALDTYGYLYTPAFEKASPLLNLIAEDDDSAGSTQFLISNTLIAGQKYELIATTYSPNVFGPFTLIIRGPTSVNVSVIPTVSTQRVYSSSLSIYHPTYKRLVLPPGAHYYDLFATTASKTVNSTLAVLASIPVYGTLYFPSFDASAPSSNVVASSGNNVASRSIQIRYNLVAGNRYFLVVRDYYAGQTGSYQLFIEDDESIDLTLLSNVTVANTTVLSSLSPTNRHFQRYQAAPLKFYYRLYQLTVPSAGTYQCGITSQGKMLGYVYENNFVATSSQLYLNAQDPIIPIEGQLGFVTDLVPNTVYYFLVTTVDPMTFGSFDSMISGKALVDLTEIADSDKEITSVSSSWTTASPTFVPYGVTQSGYYYKVFQISVPNPGLFSLTSASTIDTLGYVYQGGFGALSTAMNLVAFDNQGGANKQFLITLVLKPNINYYLVATASEPGKTGSFSVIVRGPETATLIATGN